MALWKETGSNPSPSASGTPAAGGPSTVTELHGKTPERAPEPAPAVDSTRRATPRAATTESVIAAELAIEGKIVGGGDVRIAGRFKGDVQVDGNFRIDPGARLEGQVRAGVVVVGGELQGNIDAAKQLDVLSSLIRSGSPGATRVCPHCKATVLESAAVCPGCKHHLRFGGTNHALEAGEGYCALSVDGTIAHAKASEPCEYCVVLDVRDDRGEQLTRQVVGVGSVGTRAWILPARVLNRTASRDFSMCNSRGRP